MGQRFLTTAQARAFYDRFGARQDSQAFYEDPALECLLAHGSFGSARHVFEFGCGTGRLAEMILTRALPGQARYSGCDISETMIGLARARLERFGDRVTLWQSDGPPDFSPTGTEIDRVVSTYVLDLLPDAQIAAFLNEAARALVPGGLLCTVGLTGGTDLPSRLTSGLWSMLARLRPELVGGCRPISVAARLDEDWAIEYRTVVTAWTVPSEVLVARRK